MLEELFQTYLEECRYIKGLTPNTLKVWERSFALYKKVVGADKLPTQELLVKFITEPQKKGMKPNCLNVYISGIRPFLIWLHERGHIKEPLTLRQIKPEKVVTPVYSDDELMKFINYRPKSFLYKRLHAIILALIDTGARIDEILSAKKTDFNLESLTVKLYGKGRKQRVVPISAELRRVLFLFFREHKFELAFPSNRGAKMKYTNVHYQFKSLCKTLRVEVKGFHGFRRSFAKGYVRKGSNIFFLQKHLGHERIETTQRYVQVELDDLRQAHEQTGLLTRFPVRGRKKQPTATRYSG